MGSVHHEVIYWRLAQSHGSGDKLLVPPTRSPGYCAFEVQGLPLAVAALDHPAEGRIPALSWFDDVDVVDLPGWVMAFESQLDLQAGAQ